MIRILLTDDHNIITDGIQNLLENEAEFLIAGICRNGKEAINFVKKNEVDIILLDIDMPVMNGLECAEILKADHPEVKIAMLTMHDEKAMIQRFIDLGTDGYFLKTVQKNELINGIKTIYSGGSSFSSDVTKSLLMPESKNVAVEINPALKNLSDREKEIITLIASGLTNKEIAERLFISHKTVDSHRTNIMKKIDVNNVAGVVRFAFQNGLAN